MIIRNKRYVASVFEAIAAASSIATLLAFVFKIQFAPCCGVIVLVVVGLICYIYAECQNREMKYLSIAVNDVTKLKIEEGSLFEGGDIVLIPVNEYFDVHVGDGIVDPTSIHGLFINEIWKGDANDLYHNHIKPLLDNCKEQLLENVNRSASYCNVNKYKLGTCIDIKQNGKIYVLFAFTHFDADNHAFVTRTEYHDVLINVMHHLNDMCGSKTIFMPLFGTGLSRLQSKPIQVLHYMVDCLRFECSDLNFIGGIHIRVKSLSKMELSLNYINDIFKK